MKKVTVIDTAICTRNLGDQIIMRSVMSELRSLAPDAFYMHIPSHDYIAEESYKLINQSELVVVGGTNLLSSNMDSYNQWKIGKKERRDLRGVVLLGVGWWQYQDSPNRYTRKLLSSVLSDGALQSVRDRYTQQKLQEIGIQNVVNTSCPTTWSLSEEHCALIPHDKASNVVMTVTDYNRNPDKDKYLWEILRRAYDKVYLWIQGAGDYDYAKSLYGDGVIYVDPSLEAYDELLRSTADLDYVGTRLHAGVFALKQGRRSIIVSIDNRATEISKDLGLTIVEREQLPELKQRIADPLEVSIRLPQEEIGRWKASILQALGRS